MNFSPSSDNPTSNTKPLSGRVVLVTRPRAQSEDLNTSLRALGADVLSIPTFSVTSMPSPEFEDVLRRTSKRASEVLLVFTSVNAVRSFVDLCAGAGVDVAFFARARVASVGPATADAAALEGLDSDIIPPVHTAAALAHAIERAGLPVDRTTLIYPRARDANDEIESRLGPLFASMESHVVYGTAVEAPAAPFHAPPDVVLFASSSACSYFEHVVTPTMVSIVKQSVPVACIGPATAKTAADCGYTHVVTAEIHSTAGLIDAVVNLLSTKG